MLLEKFGLIAHLNQVNARLLLQVALDKSMLLTECNEMYVIREQSYIISD